MAYQNLFEQLQETCDFIALEDDMNQIINALEKDLIEQGQTLPLVDVIDSLCQCNQDEKSWSERRLNECCDCFKPLCKD